MESEEKKSKFTFFNLTNERVVDLLSYSKMLYYIGMIETVLYALSIIGIPLLGFTLMATTFNDNPCLGCVDIYVRWRYLVTFITVLIICAMAIFTNWPKCTTQMIMKGDKETWNTICKARGPPFALFFSLLSIVIIEVWCIYVAEMYRQKYKELQSDETEKYSVFLTNIN